MKLCVVIIAAFAALAINAAAAQAQTQRRLGFAIGFPASVGLEWQAADRIAVRFDGTYRRSSVESNATPTIPIPALPGLGRIPVFEVRSSTTNTGAELGASLLFDLHSSDDLRVYVAPRIGMLISRTEFETTISGLSPAELAALTVPANQEATSSTPTGGVAIGVSRNISPRLRVFGEAGLSYSSGDVAAISTITEVSQNSFALRSGVGVVVLF